MRFGLRSSMALAAAAWLSFLVHPVCGTPLDFLAVGDPLEAELRLLDAYGPAAHRSRLRRPHLGMRPLQMVEILRLEAPPEPAPPGAEISRLRLERALVRDRDDGAAPQPGVPSRDSLFGSTPRLVQLGYPEDQRFEISAGLEGSGRVHADSTPLLAGGSGLHARIAGQTGRWLVFAHLLMGKVEGARAFADPILEGEDLIVHSEESYIAFTGTQARWALQFGRSRWHWGPGEEASLLLSKTSAPITGLALRGRIAPLRADAIALSATLDAAGGEQLAAHRLEWQPVDALRLGLAEAARYRAATWQPLYLIGVLPYVLVQRLQTQDEPDSAAVVRNNVIVSFDAAWRPAPGTRAYGELLIDDLHLGSSRNPDKLAWQLGLEGVGTVRGWRVSWGTEYTRLSRFVYTSAFGRRFAAQDRPLGFPAGPDARRVRVRGAWDLSTAWQITAAATRTDRGENDLDEPFLTGSPSVEAGRFEGVVEETRDLELGLRWWPASGVDLTLTGGYRWVEDARHVPGAASASGFGALAARLVR
jgi:capsule assembly protein Wzi